MKYLWKGVAIAAMWGLAGGLVLLATRSELIHLFIIGIVITALFGTIAVASTRGPRM